VPPLRAKPLKKKTKTKNKKLRGWFGYPLGPNPPKKKPKKKKKKKKEKGGDLALGAGRTTYLRVWP
jgi:hypothetical protein